MPGFSKSPAVEALHKAGISVERLTHVLGCSQSEMSTAVNGSHRAVPHIQETIAILVGRSRADLWPRFYDEDDTLRPGIVVLARPLRPTAWQTNVVSHAEIVRRLIACGQGHAIRLLPIKMGQGVRSLRLRSLPPLIPLRRAA